MEQYIKKSALVAEIERRFDEYSSSIFKHYDACKEAKAQELGKILTILNTLEVKDVDLEKELDEWIKYGAHTNYPWCTIPDAIRITAEHFFELGLKARKGE